MAKYDSVGDQMNKYRKEENTKSEKNIASILNSIIISL